MRKLVGDITIHISCRRLSPSSMFGYLTFNSPTLSRTVTQSPNPGVHSIFSLLFLAVTAYHNETLIILYIMLVIYATVGARTLKDLECRLNSHVTGWSLWPELVKNRLSKHKTFSKKIFKDPQIQFCVFWWHAWIIYACYTGTYFWPSRSTLGMVVS